MKGNTRTMLIFSSSFHIPQCSAFKLDKRAVPVHRQASNTKNTVFSLSSYVTYLGLLCMLDIQFAVMLDNTKSNVQYNKLIVKSLITDCLLCSMRAIAIASV